MAIIRGHTIMPYEAAWYVDQRILYEYIYGDITFEELGALSTQVRAMYDVGTVVVHTLIDVRDIEHFPQVNLKEMFSQVRSVPTENSGWVVIITGNKVIRFLSSVYFQFNQRRFHTVETLETALAFLAERDVTLDADTLRAAASAWQKTHASGKQRT
jgi:hypothetical protein